MACDLASVSDESKFLLVREAIAQIESTDSAIYIFGPARVFRADLTHSGQLHGVERRAGLVVWHAFLDMA